MERSRKGKKGGGRNNKEKGLQGAIGRNRYRIGRKRKTDKRI